MNKLKKTSIIALLIILLLGGVYFYGKYQGANSLKIPENKMTSQIILDKIQDQYFLVTKTLFYNDKVSITISKDSGWKDLLWGETITANGIVRVDIGVDMNKLKGEDIVIDQENEELIVYIPEAEVLDSSLFGDLDIDTKKGLFNNIKSVFSSDKSEDYNRAVKELEEQARYAAVQNKEMFNEASDDSVKLLTLILNDLGLEYKITLKKRENN